MQGLAMQRLILAMAERDGIDACDFEFVMVAGHFLARDENIFTFFEGVQVKPPEPSGQQWRERLPLNCCTMSVCRCHRRFWLQENGVTRCVVWLQVDTYTITRCTTDRAKRRSAYFPRPWKAPRSRPPVSCRECPQARHQRSPVGGQLAVLPRMQGRCWLTHTIEHISESRLRSWMIGCNGDPS